MDLARKFDGKKFMWDGDTYSDEDKAREVMKKYEADGFETRLVKEGSNFYVFSRRVVKEVVVEGTPPV